MSDIAGPDPRLIRHALEKLRGRDGLTAARILASRNGDAAALLELKAVLRYAAVHKVDAPQAAMELIKRCVREDLEGSQKVVADAVLGLGAFTDTYADQQVDNRSIAVLSSNLLGRRRQTLLTRWTQLHEALDLPPTDAPSDRILRGTVEPETLTSLAEHLIRREVYSFDSSYAQPSESADGPPLSSSGQPLGRVIVIGGAVMDAKYRMKRLPQVDMATEAHSLTVAPGGKGLYQAVAAVRLGLRTSLIAAVAADVQGDEIVEFLDQEGVDTSLITRVTGARTPLVAVLELEFGESAAVFSRDSKSALELADIERIRHEIETCDVVLMTFETPKKVLESALRVVSQCEKEKPITIVTPGQPYDTNLSGQSLSAIDYMVARKQELERYKPLDGGPLDIDDVARVLMTQGVETLCVTDRAGCSVYSRARGLLALSSLPSPYREAAIARDAFCAALAAALIDHKGELSRDVANFATAAMTAATADHPINNPMPDRRRIERMLALPFEEDPW